MAKSNLPAGFLNVNKAAGMTAHDVVARLRKISGVKQIGHAGTLDPMARGVLPLAIGRACRLLRFLPDDKVYLASILFGKRTDTDDIEGTVIATSKHVPERDEITKSLANFVGEIEQVPPLYSAVHLDGQRLYELARKGEIPAEIPKRKVHVFAIEQLDYHVLDTGPDDLAQLYLRIHCSSGTYIRSIARDLGEALGSAACLASLQRERAGLFALEKSYGLEELSELAQRGELAACLEAPEDRLPQAKIDLTEEESKRLKFGQQIKVRAKDIAVVSAANAECIHKNTDSLSKYVLALNAGKLIAVCSKVENQTAEQRNVCSELEESDIVELKPEVVLADGSP